MERSKRGDIFSWSFSSFRQDCEAKRKHLTLVVIRRNNDEYRFLTKRNHVRSRLVIFFLTVLLSFAVFD